MQKQTSTDSRYVLTSQGYSIPLKVALTTPAPVVAPRDKSSDGKIPQPGAQGFMIRCAGCGEKIESLGLRCCADESPIGTRRERFMGTLLRAGNVQCEAMLTNKLRIVTSTSDTRLCLHCQRPMIGAAPSRLYCTTQHRKAAFRKAKRAA